MDKEKPKPKNIKTGLELFSTPTEEMIPLTKEQFFKDLGFPLPKENSEKPEKDS